ncbi:MULTISPECIES: PE family protein [Mycobacterium]|uniref:PE family protein n=2 Tax=Mycobacterium TaxID=1763 RepID=A0A7I7P873_9MYCO|nr:MULTISPECIES: PE family protein [Mycobacterium]MCV7394507.1 PE family protein [Mycobacterium paraseoulense]MCV7439157.1 PE family protein [Mycobacterium seoulense]ORB42280.1 PE family protein [Mycobacterium paraseoulense]BBY04222.1 PE family protein [Mycobacterium seoulense]BBZ73436.1 PE family protein [Mycobacterium paraseoulense]
MSYVNVDPEKLSAAASNLQSITAALSAGNAAAAGPTTAVVPAAADEVSALTAARFAVHAQRYQILSARAVAIHELLAAALASGAGSYAGTEAANAAASAL